MANSIRLSPQHGVNPSVQKCFWCGRDMGLLLLGKLKGDAEAPREMVFSIEPCEKCAEKFSQGVLLIEVDGNAGRFNGNERVAIRDQNGVVHWPTGRHAVLHAEALKGGKPGTRMLCDKDTMDNIMAMKGE